MLTLEEFWAKAVAANAATMKAVNRILVVEVGIND
jgi:hypothetical protein